MICRQVYEKNARKLPLKRLQTTKCRNSAGNEVPEFYKSADVEDKTSFAYRKLSRGTVKLSGVPEKYISRRAIFISRRAIYISRRAIFVSRRATYFAALERNFGCAFGDFTRDEHFYAR